MHHNHQPSSRAQFHGVLPAGAANNAEQAARLELEGHIVQNLPLWIVAKIDVAKFNAATMAALGKQQWRRIRGVFNFRFDVDKVKHVLCGKGGIGVTRSKGVAKGEEASKAAPMLPQQRTHVDQIALNHAGRGE